MMKNRWTQAEKPRSVKLIVSNVPRSASVGELWDLLSQYCEVADIVFNESPITGRRWALVEVEDTEPRESEEDRSDEDDDHEGDDSIPPALDQRSVDRLIVQLNGLWLRGKSLKVRRRQQTAVP
jgi:hypothetical protein